MTECKLETKDWSLSHILPQSIISIVLSYSNDCVVVRYLLDLVDNHRVIELHCADDIFVFPGEYPSLRVLDLPMSRYIPFELLVKLPLTSISVDRSPSWDISELSTLTSLTCLDIGYYACTDLTPLASLTLLTSLSMYNFVGKSLKPLSSLTLLASLDLNHFRGDADALAPLSSLTSLTSLRLPSYRPGQFSGEPPLAPLSTLARLTSLDLNSFDDERLGPLARLPITYLDLSSVDDGDLTPLIQLPLQILYIRIYSGIVPKMLREKVGKLCAPVASG